MENRELLEQMKLYLIEVNKKLDFFIEVYNKQFLPNRNVAASIEKIEDFSPLKED